MSAASDALEIEALSRRPLGAIAIVVDPAATPKGKQAWRHGPGPNLALVFHDADDREVWLDQMREQGLQG